nr:myosin-11-like [Parasteatoda tepidariorum]
MKSDKESDFFIKALVLNEKLDEIMNIIQTRNLRLIPCLRKRQEEKYDLENLYQKMAIDIDRVKTCTVATLNDAEDQLNEKNHQIIDLQQQLDMKENDLNEILPKLEKEKCERKKLQLEKFSSDARLNKLEEDIVIYENKNQEV